MTSRSDLIRRSPWFAFAIAFVIWTLNAHFFDGDGWARSAVFAVLFAILMTATFELLKRRNRS